MSRTLKDRPGWVADKIALDRGTAVEGMNIPAHPRKRVVDREKTFLASEVEELNDYLAELDANPDVFDVVIERIPRQYDWKATRENGFTKFVYIPKRVKVKFRKRYILKGFLSDYPADPAEVDPRTWADHRDGKVSRVGIIRSAHSVMNTPSNMRSSAYGFKRYPTSPTRRNSALLNAARAYNNGEDIDIDDFDVDFDFGGQDWGW